MPKTVYVRSGHGTPHSVSNRHRARYSRGRRILVRVGAACFLLGEAHGKIIFGAPCSARESGREFHLVVLGTALFYLLDPPPLQFGVYFQGHLYLFPSSSQVIYAITLVPNHHLCCPAFFLPPHVSAAAVSVLPYLHCRFPRCLTYPPPR